MIKAVIFDMDGTMVDSESMWDEATKELAGMYGKESNETLRLQMMGRKEDEALTIFKNYLKIDVKVSELQRIRKAMLLSKLNMLVVNPGLIQLLDLLDKKGIKKAVATSAFRDFASKVLEYIHVNNRFEIVITGDQVEKGKPNPEIFLKTATALGIAPIDCLVLEDAQSGVESGYHATMKVIAIPHIHSIHHDFSKATKVVKSMMEIDERMLESL